MRGTKSSRILQGNPSLQGMGNREGRTRRWGEGETRRWGEDEISLRCRSRFENSSIIWVEYLKLERIDIDSVGEKG